MIPDDQLDSLAAEIQGILADAGWPSVPGPDLGRIEVIAYRATLESILRQCSPRSFRRSDAAILRDRIRPPSALSSPSRPPSNKECHPFARGTDPTPPDGPALPPGPHGDRADPDPLLGPSRR